ncbi:hypothetical protein V8E55_007212 [Tylopilus felleus]
MSSSMTRDDLKIPKLDATGKNWPTWKTKLEHAFTVPTPTDPAYQYSPMWIPITAAELQEVVDYEKASLRSNVNLHDMDNRWKAQSSNVFQLGLTILIEGLDSISRSWNRQLYLGFSGNNCLALEDSSLPLRRDVDSVLQDEFP